MSTYDGQGEDMPSLDKATLEQCLSAKTHVAGQRPTSVSAAQRRLAPHDGADASLCNKMS